MPARWPRGALVGTALAVAALLAALGLYRGEAFWSTSDGVYALTARELLHGGDLYRQIAAAQPPGIFLAGAALLGIDDSLTMLRAGLELCVLATALLCGTAVLRLTGRLRWAVAATLLAPFTPIALHENALTTPETLGAPLLLATALLAADPRRARAAALAGALCVAVKLSFALPVLAIVLAVAHRRRLLPWLAGGVAVLAAGGTAVWGGALWGNVVTAQWQTGSTPWHQLGGYLAQAAWNELPLAVLGAVGLWALVRRGPLPPLARTLAAAGAAGLVLVLSDLKLGSYVNVVQVAEAPLLALALAGLAAPRRAGDNVPAGQELRRPLVAAVAVVAAAAAALGLAQSVSLLAAPADPRPYTRPLAASGPRRLVTPDRVRAAARQAAACPAGAPYPGIPFIAFVARRRVPGDQPDRFILHTAYHRAQAVAYLADLGRACPRRLPAWLPRP